MKQQKGITLVALVITIIILLILAGITLGTLKDSGLFNNAKRAKNEYGEKANEENQTLKGYEDEVQTYINELDAANQTS